MNRLLCRLVAALAILIAAAPIEANGPGGLALPETERKPLEPNAASLPKLPSEHAAIRGARLYRQLRLRDAQCLAVQHAPLAGALARERQELCTAHPCCQHPIVHCLMPCHCDDRANRLRQCILYYTELEIRNRSAGAALELFFRIAEFEAKDDLLVLGRTALAGAYDQAEEVADKGFKLPIELASLERQKLEADADRVRVQGALLDFNARLKGLIGQDQLPIDERLWPETELGVSYDPIDVDAAIQVAMHQRAELQLLRILDRDLDAKTLPVVRAFLQGVNGSLGAQAVSHSPIGKMFAAIKALVTRRAAEQDQRSDQIQQLLQERELAVATEVRQAAAQWVTQGHLVDFDRQRVLAWDARVKEVEDRLAKSESTFLDVLQAKLEWYKARAVLTADVMAWHRAQVQLRLAQGVFVGECCGQ